MKVSDRFFPRVWDGEKYFYPVFSELGVTYENESLPLTDENIKSLDWALGWHFHPDSKNTSLEFDHILEACTGLKDKNGKLIYEDDIVRWSLCRGDGDICENYQIIWRDNCAAFGCLKSNGDILDMFSQPELKAKVIGNVHENPDLLESEE